MSFGATARIPVLDRMLLSPEGSNDLGFEPAGCFLCTGPKDTNGEAIDILEPAGFATMMGESGFWVEGSAYVEALRGEE